MNAPWIPTEFGTAEKFMEDSARFYSHRYDEVGRADVIRAAKHHIETSEQPDEVRLLALHLLETEGAETDLYQRQSNERWLVDAGDMLNRAEAAWQALLQGLKDLASA